MPAHHLLLRRGHKSVLAALFAAVFTASSWAADRLYSIRVSDIDLAQDVVAGGGRPVADYGSFQYIDVDESTVQGLKGNPAVEVHDDSHLVRLNAGVVDTRTEAAQARSAALTAFTGKRLRLIQFAGPLQPQWHAELEKAGLDVVCYIPNNTYLVYGDSTGLNGMRAMSQSRAHVRWEGAYQDEDKIHPQARQAAAKRRGAAPETQLYAIQMVGDPEANRATMALVNALKLAPVRRDVAVLKYRNVVAPLSPDALTVLAAQPDVISIRPYVERKKFDERQDQIVAGNLSGTGPSGPGYLAWLASMGFTQAQFEASGFVVNVTDSGLDDGTTAPNHFGLYRNGDTNQTSRVAYNRLEGTPNSGSTLSGCDGHGTLNAHIIGGFNDLTGFPHADSAGYRFGLGVCPFVKVGSSVIFDPDFFTSPDYADLTARAYNDGARFSSDSWGADTFGGYDIDAQEYDALVRDAQPAGSAFPTAGNQEMTIVFAAGNAGPGSSTVGSPGTAKNVITVGAAENVHSHSTANGGNNTSGNDGCDTPDSEANSADDIAVFSSRGPCSDSRSKPELVAPGTHVTGGVAQDTPPPSPGGTGNDLGCFDSSGVCGLAGSGTIGDPANFFPQGQQFYSTSSGTSHSTPAVAGGAALVRQYFINQGWTVPSPAMVKAYLVNSARYMTGADANDSLWSNNQGMGEMNLGFAFDGIARILRDQVASDKITGSGQQRQVFATINDVGQPFRVTLTWTDAPGSTSGNAYNNDLDLVVVAGGNTYKGNVFSGANSATGGSADPRNNTESVFLPAGVNGAVTITVNGVNINSDGVPNEGPGLDQDFALVIYNAVETDQAVISTAGSVLTAESCGVGNGAVDPDEVVTVDLSLQNVGNVDTTNLVATLVVTNGVTSPSAPQNYGVLTAGGAAVARSFTFTVSGACGETVTATLQLQDGAADYGEAAYTFPIGGAIESTQTNENTSVITINDSGAASLYPSDITVSGAGASVSKVTVSIPSFSHTWPDDMDLLLVGPGGENVMLMSAAGGGNDINNVSLTFDDDAAGGPPDESELTSGTYRPSNYESGQVFDAPAPSAPFGSALSVFDGTDPNGAWSLFVYDAATGDSGIMALGWKLGVTTAEPLCCASNQPPILATIGDRSVTVSNLLEFTVMASELSDGDDITLSASNLPSWATFDTVTNAVAVTNTFSGTPQATGTYAVTFYAVDKDGADMEQIDIYVTDSSGCAGTNLINENFDASTSVPASWIDGGTANDTVSSHYQSAPNCRAFGPADTLETPGVDNPTQLVFYVDSSGGGDGQTASVDYSVDGGSYVELATFTVSTAGGEEVFDLTSSPDLSASANVKFRFNSTFFTWYLDDVRVTGGCSGGGGGTPPVLVPIGNRAVVVSNTLEFAVSAVPTDGDTVTLSVSNAPAGSVFGSVDELGTFSWTNAAPVGVYTSTFYATDTDGTVSEEITITLNEAPVAGAAAGVWINEIHYDNTGGDINEGVELAGPAGTDLGAYTLLAYNGANSELYASNTVSVLIDDEGCGYGAVWIPIGGLQNGVPDGVALVFNNTNVIQFLSYEGSFTADRGPASGLTSDDIGVSESGGTPVGDALQLTGSGTNYAQFAWNAPAPASRGDLNPGQTIVPCDGTDDTDGDGIPDDWETLYYGGPTNANATSDTDGDGFTAWEEYLADTHPTNGMSYLRLDSVSNTASFVVSFPSSTARVYSLHFSSNLLSDTWSDVYTNVPGQSGTTSLVDTNDSIVGTYRIGAGLP